MRLRYHWDWLRSGYLFIPSIMVLMAVVLALLAIELDSFLYSDGRVIEHWYSQGGPEESRTILGMIAGSMITIVGIVYSIAMVNLTLASDQFGPRLIRTFMTDMGTQLVLGAFLATFVYSVMVLLAIESGANDPGPSAASATRTGDADAEVWAALPEPTSFAPVISIWLGVALSMVCLGMLIYFIHHVAQAIQAPNVIDSVARELERSIRRHFPEARESVETIGHPANREAIDDDLPPDFEDEARPLPVAVSGYLQFIDHEVLVQICSEAQLVMRLDQRPGDFVVAGGSVGLVWPPDRVDEEVERRLRSVFLIGVQRTPPEDVEFSISQLVEIAVRALGNNDPFTAINCVDRLGAAMCLLVGRKIPSRKRFDSDGQIRVIARATRFGGIINTAFDQIRQYGADDTALTIRLLEVIALIASRVDNLTDGAALLRQAVMIERGSRQTIVEEYDRRDIAERFQDILNQLDLQEVAGEVDRWKPRRVNA